MEQLYHVICTDNVRNATYVIIEALADDNVSLSLQEYHGNSLSFNIFVRCQ